MHSNCERKKGIDANEGGYKRKPNSFYKITLFRQGIISKGDDASSAHMEKGSKKQD